MELHFLGQTCPLFPKQILTIPSENTACYRGHKYNLRVPMMINQPQTPDSQMSAVIYRYRGVSYVVEHYHPTKPNKALFHC